MSDYLLFLIKKALLILMITAPLHLSGCATLEADMPSGWSSERLYEEGVDSLRHEDYTFAIEHFEMMESRFPFEALTQQAMLMSAFAYYKVNDPESAIAAANRFIKLYPTHADVDYAYYLRGLAHFHSRDSFMDDLFKVDPAKRDPESVQRSFYYFSELITRFPGSRYVADARQRMLFLRNSLARNEVYIARHYIERGAYIAAVNHSKEVLERFDGTPSTGDALAAMTEAYLLLKQIDLAQDALKVLQYNYPDHPAIAELLDKLANA